MIFFVITATVLLNTCILNLYCVSISLHGRMYVHFFSSVLHRAAQVSTVGAAKSSTRPPLPPVRSSYVYIYGAALLSPPLPPPHGHCLPAPPCGAVVVLLLLLLLPLLLLVTLLVGA